MAEDKKLVSSESNALDEKQYIVDGALLTCDHSFDKSIRIALTADPNREYEISAGIPATDIDTTPVNIKGGFGKCGNKDVDCVPEFLPKWFTISNSAYYQDVRSVTISELKSLITDYRAACENVEKTTNVIIQGELELYGQSQTEPTTYKLMGQLKYMEADKAYLDVLERNAKNKVYQVLPGYENWKQAIALALKALESVMGAARKGIYGELQKLLTVGDMLICKKNLGVIAFVDNGQTNLEEVDGIKQEKWPYYLR